MKTAIVIGATGLVGAYLVNELNDSNLYNKVIIDFDNIDASLISGDDIFCAIGTTLKKAGSKENQYKIDCEYPFNVAKLAKENNVKQFILVSSIGADAKSSNFYLKTKGE